MALKNNTWTLNQWYDQDVAGNVTYSGVKQLWAWGVNEYGDLGQNSRVWYSSPVQIPGNWSSFCGNSVRTSLAIKTDGSLWSWGYNNNGEIGDDSRTQRSSPLQIPGTWSSVWTGNTRKHQAAIKSGQLWMWGANNGGCLGQNQAPAQLAKVSSPVQVGTGTDWSTISLSYYGGLALKTDGSMWGWGEADNGLMGLNSQTYYSSPVQIPGTDWNYALAAAGGAGYAIQKVEP